MGKTIIVISHDDRYFDSADQLLRLSNGKRLADASLEKISEFSE
jgi:putative ATP-binding cassette transporter